MWLFSEWHCLSMRAVPYIGVVSWCCCRCRRLGRPAGSGDVARHVARLITEVFAQSISRQSSAMWSHSASVAIVAVHQRQSCRQVLKLRSRCRRKDDRYCSGNDQLVSTTSTWQSIVRVFGSSVCVWECEVVTGFVFCTFQSPVSLLKRFAHLQ